MHRFAFTLALAASLALAGTAAAQSARVSGTIVDTSQAVLPAVAVTAERVDPAERSTTTVMTDRLGHFTFADLRPGSYTLIASLPGFETLRAQLTLSAGDDVDRNLVLHVGSLQETITVTSTDTPQPRRTAVPVPEVAPPPAPRPVAPGAVRVGGNIKAPRKIADVHPVYPAALVAQGAEGTVSLIATIGVDGFVRDISIASSSNDDFARAASDAVSQWQFTPTLLNGVPVEVRMRVNISFKKN